MTAEEFLKNRKNIHDKTISDCEQIMDFWEIAEIMQEYADHKQLIIADVSNSLQEHKQVIKDLIETYIINLDDDGNLKATLTEVMELSDRAVKLIKQ